jgi:cobalt/nickel transport system permease protein
MASFDSTILDLGHLDNLSYNDTIIHRLDPRAKLLVTMGFIIVVVSFPKYALTSLVPLFFFPILMVYLAELPVGFLLKKLLIISPFAVFIGIFNPFLDREVLVHLGPFDITGGWISFGSVILRFVLTVGAALVLIATTSFPGICNALDRLKVPRLFVIQLMFLYRFIFVLTEEALRMVRARRMRSVEKKRPDLKQFVQMVGLLFIRTLERAERIYRAMRNRGFDGEIRTVKRLRFTLRDLLFLCLFIMLFVVFRFYNPSQLLGNLVLQAFQ